MKEKRQHIIHLLLFLSCEQHCNSRNLKYTERSIVFTLLDKLLFTILWKKENIHHYPIREEISLSLGQEKSSLSISAHTKGR